MRIRAEQAGYCSIVDDSISKILYRLGLILRVIKAIRMNGLSLMRRDKKMNSDLAQLLLPIITAYEQYYRYL